MVRFELRLVGVLLLTPSLLAVACGGKSDADGEAPTFLDEPTFRQAFPDQICALLAGCCNKVSFPIDSAACQTAARGELDNLSDGTVYDGAAAAACLNGYSAALARCAVPSDSSIESCDVVYSGAVPPGGACELDKDCAGDAYCVVDVSGAFVCESQSVDIPAYPAAVEGEVCVGTCSGDGSEPCGVPVGPGSPAEPKICYATDGLVCEFDTGTTGVCVPAPGIGEQCDSYCAPGAYCDYELSQCAATLRDGEFCESSDQCQSRQCGGGRCGALEMIDAEICSDF